MGFVKKQLELFIGRKTWRKRIPRNYTRIVQMFDLDRAEVGDYTYGSLYVLTDGGNTKLKIGRFCSIGPKVSFILASDHPVHNLSTYPFKNKFMGGQKEALSKGDIVVGDDVWIGHQATVLSGVKIGQGAVIAAGAVVTKDIPPYAIAAGIPAKVVSYRFSEEKRNILSRIDYSRMNADYCRENIDLLYTDISSDEVSCEMLEEKYASLLK